MKLRGRLLVASFLLVLVPLAILAYLIREQTAERLRAQYERRVASLADGIEADLRERDRFLRSRLRALERAMADDNRLRLALAAGEATGSGADAAWLLDYAGEAMELLGLDLLQIQDASGRILSSGHFRNDFDRIDAETPARLALAEDEAVLVEARRPEGPFLALARTDSLRLGDRVVRLVGGSEISDATLAALSPDDDLTVLLRHPAGALAPPRGAPPGLPNPAYLPATSTLREVDGFLVRALPLPAATLPTSPEDASLGRAHLFVVHSLAPMRGILRGLDARLALAWGLVAAGTILIAAGASTVISRPLERLAAKTADLDLDRLDDDFSTGRTDEIGELSRFLEAMRRRLAASVGRLREAERRATLGELARQVNHDLRNGITPIRNVLRHLGDVARETPDALPAVWHERSGTLDAGLGYLEELAGHWRKLAARPERTACDLASVLRAVAAGRRVEDGGPVELRVPDDLPPVAADPVGLRRVVENLVANAAESLEGRDGRVRISAREEPAVATGRGSVRLEVRDDGPGIPAELRERVFDDFWTTKPGGTGLGLSIVRRLVSDSEGTLALESEPGLGTTAIVTLPIASPPPPGEET
jgi:signal transduction histidine kinase